MYKIIMVLLTSQRQTQGIFKLKQQNLIWLCYEIQHISTSYVLIRIIRKFFLHFFKDNLQKYFCRQEEKVGKIYFRTCSGNQEIMHYLYQLQMQELVHVTDQSFCGNSKWLESVNYCQKKYFIKCRKVSWSVSGTYWLCRFCLLFIICEVWLYILSIYY